MNEDFSSPSQLNTEQTKLVKQWWYNIEEIQELMISSEVRDSLMLVRDYVNKINSGEFDRKVLMNLQEEIGFLLKEWIPYEIIEANSLYILQAQAVLASKSIPDYIGKIERWENPIYFLDRLKELYDYLKSLGDNFYWDDNSQVEWYVRWEKRNMNLKFYILEIIESLTINFRKNSIFEAKAKIDLDNHLRKKEESGNELSESEKSNLLYPEERAKNADIIYLNFKKLEEDNRLSIEKIWIEVHEVKEYLIIAYLNQIRNNIEVIKDFIIGTGISRESLRENLEKAILVYKMLTYLYEISEKELWISKDDIIVIIKTYKLYTEVKTNWLFNMDKIKEEPIEKFSNRIITNDL